MEMERFVVRIEDREDYYMSTAEVDMAIVHVAKRREDGVLQTETFYTGMSEEDIFRMYLSLGRAIQNSEFGHISKDIGKVVEPNLFRTVEFSRGFRRDIILGEDDE
jgi:hypothetical protein